MGKAGDQPVAGIELPSGFRVERIEDEASLEKREEPQADGRDK